jgi:hypothetical protein
MKNHGYKIVQGAVLAGLALLLAACGGGSDGSSTPTATVSGTVMAGPANGARIKVKTVLGNYSTTSAPTDSSGAFTVSLPATFLAQELIFETVGGTFPDEATSATGVALGRLAARMEAGTLVAGAYVVIDPASTIIGELIKGGKTRIAAQDAFTNAFGYTPDSSVRPVFACASSAATTAQRLAGVRVAAFSRLTMDLGLSPDKQFELIQALADDLSDDALDGKKTGGVAVITASGTQLPADIGNRFANALMDFQFSAENRSKLKPDQIGTPAFVTKALTTNYLVEYLPGDMGASTGKTMFRIRLTNRSDNTPASGKAVTLRPYMYMSTKSHTTPMDVVVDNGDGTYSCSVYYVMSTVMNGISMGVWELKVTIDASESVRFYPMVGMPMGSTTLAKLNGIDDKITGLAGVEKRTWFLFNDGLTAGMGGSYTFKLFLATKEMDTVLAFPAVRTGDMLKDETGTPWTVNTISVEVSTDKATWFSATDAANSGHWTAAGLNGLTAGTAGKIHVRLKVNDVLKTTDGLPLAADGSNGYQTFTVTPTAMPG